jgi:ABC-type dipeptide/oligopeptide/nickel transport system permease subunit
VHSGPDQAEAVDAATALCLLRRHGAGAEPGASWGSLLARNRGDISLIPHTTFMPVIFISITVMVLNYFGDYFRNQIDGRESRI